MHESLQFPTSIYLMFSNGQLCANEFSNRRTSVGEVTQNHGMYLDFLLEDDLSVILSVILT